MKNPVEKLGKREKVSTLPWEMDVPGIGSPTPHRSINILSDGRTLHREKRV
jgi:hypothetical protein